MEVYYMKIWIYPSFILIIVIVAAVAFTACTHEAVILQARVDSLERENSELQSAVTALQSALDISQNELSVTRNELHNHLAALAAQEEAAQQASQGGPLAITYGGEPNPDMSWPFNYGVMNVGLRINLGEDYDVDDIVWRSENETIFTVAPAEAGMTAVVTPVTIGSAELVVTVGEQETRSWVRIT